MEFGTFKTRFVVAALCLIGTWADSQTPISDFRLPTNFKPISYRLRVITHLENRFMFEGEVRIRMTCTKATDAVVLHANEIYIYTRGVTMVDGAGEPVALRGVSLVSTREVMLIVAYGEFIVGDEYVLTVPFRGNITDNTVGYYRSSYVDKATNRTRWLAMTQFKPVDARRAFPCFDEPAMKAKFQISIGHEKHLTSVSNMPLKKTSPLPSYPDYVLDEFEESVPMSTYLVAYMVSDFAHVESGGRHGDVKFRVLARRDAVVQTGFAKKLAPSVSGYYADYFDEKFPLPKQDMVALPDFSHGVMENWGLVTYRETKLLIEPKVATIEDLQRVAEFIAHEQAHQWFGNLVTINWWTNLWMKEGFVTYIAARGVDFLYPEWNFSQVQTVQNFIRVLTLDSLQSSHPVLMTFVYTENIEQIFDVISYTKSSYLLHMINTFLGEKAFKQGIRNYIHKYRYSNAEPDNLWSALSDEAHRVGSLSNNITLKEIMDTWTLQTGYPVIKVVRDYSANTMTLSQKRFITTKSNSFQRSVIDKSISTNENSCWWVPLTMTSSSEANFNKTKADMWLNCKNDKFTVPLSSKENWVILNVQLAGLYRVMYDKHNWMSIIETLNDPGQYKKIHTLNRVQLLEDALTFAYTGDLDYGIAYEMLRYLKHEKEYTPWFAALNGLDPIGKIMKRTPNEGVHQAYMRRLLLPVYNQFRDMTDELENFEDIRLKNLVIESACHNRIKDCADQALQLFQKWMKTADPDNNNKLPRELKSTIYCEAIKHGDVKEWDFLWKRYEQSNVAAEKSKFLLALSCTSKEWLLERLLNWTIGKDALIRKQDAIFVFNAVADNDNGFYVAKRFLYRKIKKISKYFYPRVDLVNNYIMAVGFQMKTKEELDEIQSFINKSSAYLKQTKLAVKQTIETLKKNIAWISKFYLTIVNHMV